MSGGVNGEVVEMENTTTVRATVRDHHPRRLSVRRPRCPLPQPSASALSLFAPLYKADLQFNSAFTDHFADLVAGASSLCPKSYDYDSLSPSRR